MVRVGRESLMGSRSAGVSNEHFARSPIELLRDQTLVFRPSGSCSSLPTVERYTMVASIAAVLLAAQSTAPSTEASFAHPGWVLSTVGQSEWCPAGNVMLDLKTGRYALTRRAPRRLCNQIGLQRPVIHGTLVRAQLTTIRSAYLRVLSDGLENPACRDGGRPGNIVVDNGGLRVLVVTSGMATMSAPDDLACWSEAGTALQNAVDRIFSPDDYAARRNR